MNDCSIRLRHARGQHIWHMQPVIYAISHTCVLQFEMRWQRSVAAGWKVPFQQVEKSFLPSGKSKTGKGTLNVWEAAKPKESKKVISNLYSLHRFKAFSVELTGVWGQMYLYHYRCDRRRNAVRWCGRAGAWKARREQTAAAVSVMHFWATTSIELTRRPAYSHASASVRHTYASKWWHQHASSADTDHANMLMLLYMMI